MGDRVGRCVRSIPVAGSGTCGHGVSQEPVLGTAVFRVAGAVTGAVADFHVSAASQGPLAGTAEASGRLAVDRTPQANPVIDLTARSASSDAVSDGDLVVGKGGGRDRS